MQVARLAGIEKNIVNKAAEAGKHIETKLQVMSTHCSQQVQSPIANTVPAWVFELPADKPDL